MARKAEVIFVGDAASIVKASAEAKAAIKGVQDQASKKSGLDNLPTLGGKITTSLLAVTPVVTGLTGALGGLAASATAAATGAGVVGVGGLGALVTGLGSIALVAKPAADGFKKVTTALDAYNQTLATHGTTAKQAAAAHAKLNAVVSQNGGAPVLAAAKAWDALGDSFAKLTGPATSTMFKALNDGLSTAKDLLPTVAGIANKSMASLASALQAPLKMLASNEFKGILKSLGDTFSKSIGPAVKAASDVFLGFARIAKASGPYVVELAKGMETLAAKFAAATANPKKLGDVISGLVANTKSWMNLIGAAGRLIFDVFNKGVNSGRGMVDNLTRVVNQWDRWVTSARGSSAITSFFQQAATFTKELFGALSPVIQAFSVMSTGALPVYISLMSKLKSIMGPLTYAFVAYKVALVAATVAEKASFAIGSLKSAAGPITAGAVPFVGGAVRNAPAPIAGAVPQAEQYDRTIMDAVKNGLGSALAVGFKGLMIGTLGTGIAQAIGSSIHGAAGQAVKTIGTDASIGAGFGSIFGPPGIAGGAMIGGLVGSVTSFITNHVGDEGKRFAAKFTAGLPDAVSKSTTAALAKATNSISDTKFQRTLDANTPGFAGHPSARGQHAAALDTAKIQGKYFNQGFAAGQAFVSGMRSVKDPSSTILLSDFLTKLKTLPPQVQPEAAKVMFSFAAGLQQAGKIPYKGLESVLKGLEGQIPGFSAYLENQGQIINQVFSKTLLLSPATKTLTNTLAGYRKQFGDMAISTKVTGQNIDQNIATAMAHLETTVATSSGQTRRDAVAEVSKLHDQTVSLFNSMGSKVQTSIKNMATAIKDGSASAAKVAGENLGDFASNVGQAMQNGVLSVGQGMKLIIDNTNKALKEMGQKQLTPIQVGAMTLGTAKQQAMNASGHAGGGLVQIGQPGQVGHDSVGLNVGGMPIKVAPGEQVAVFNRHQLPIVNAALGRMGGLRGLFSKVRTPHYMASGGTLSYGQLEGLWDSAGGPKGLASVAAAIAMAESGGRDVMQQGQPFATTGWGYWQITPGGPQYLDPMTNARAAVAKYHGAGNTFQPWTTFNDGAYRQFLKGGVPAMGAALAHIMSPKVSGSGVMATIARAAMGLLTKGANAFLGSKQPAGGGTGSVAGLPSGGGFSPSQLTSFDGMQVAKWIVPELLWARSRGWAGRVTSGWRSPSAVVHGVFATAPQGQSEHQYDIYPGGAVDVSDYQRFAQIIKGYPGKDKLIQLGIDPLHFSGTGHARGGLLPFVGSYKNGGVVPRDGMAYVHKHETIVPSFASGGTISGRLTGLTPANPPGYMNQLINSAVHNATHNGLLYPLDAALAALNKLAAVAKNPIKVNLEIAKLTQLQNWQTAIASLKTQVKDLAGQAAQAWNSLQTGKINATHDAAIAAINGGADATTLAAMQAQDTATANAQQLASLQSQLATDQSTADHSGGQTHLDALAAVKADQAAIDQFNRQQTEQQLQDNINAATQKADDAQTIALNGLTQQTTDYQNGLEAQLGVLVDSLNKRKITYAQWAADVNAILAQYGLSAATDASTEAAVTAGPGPAGKKPKQLKKTTGWGLNISGWGGARAGGGSVRPGYVYRVGEQGPEDVVFGRSGTVLSHSQTNRGGVPGVTIMNAHFSGTRAARQFADRLAYRAAIGTA